MSSKCNTFLLGKYLGRSPPVETFSGAIIDQIFNFLKFRSMYTNADKRLKELNALNQYQIEEVESSDESPETRFDDLSGTPDEEESLLISDDFVISEEDFAKKKEKALNLSLIHI